MPAFTPGMRLHDRYLLEQRIGSGGMAQVWRAHDLVLGRQVAVKTLIGQAASDPSLRVAAKREAQAAAKLTHAHITGVHDYAELETADGHVVPYLVMELLHGETLADRLARGPIPWPQAAGIAAQIASALAAAHAQGVVHQDIKPANIMLTPSGVKVLDFGIAAMSGHRENTGWIIGTPAYAPPERLHQAPPDPAADVFSLGVILCEMVTGRQPFPSHTWEEVARSRYTPPTLPPAIPEPAASAIRNALDSSPQRRPTASALARTLEGGPAPTLMTPAGSVSAAASVPPPRNTQAYREPQKPLSKGLSPALVAGVAVAVLAVVIGAIFIVSSFFTAEKDPIAGGTPTGGTVTTPGGTVTSPTPAAASVQVLLQQFGNEVETGIANGQVRKEKVKDLRNQVTSLNRAARTKSGSGLPNEIDDVQGELEDLADNGEIAPQLHNTLNAILVQLSTAVGSTR